MKVLIVNTSEKIGGAAIAANRLMDALNRNGVKAKMLVRDKQTDHITVCAIPSAGAVSGITDAVTAPAASVQTVAVSGFALSDSMAGAPQPVSRIRASSRHTKRRILEKTVMVFPLSGIFLLFYHAGAPFAIDSGDILTRCSCF